MAAYRCDTCDVNWPLAMDYRTCPGCRGYCANTGDEPLDADEALSARYHCEFEHYYAAREQRLHAEALAALPTAEEVG